MSKKTLAVDRSLNGNPLNEQTKEGFSGVSRSFLEVGCKDHKSNVERPAKSVECVKKKLQNEQIFKFPSELFSVHDVKFEATFLNQKNFGCISFLILILASTTVFERTTYCAKKPYYGLCNSCK